MTTPVLDLICPRLRQDLTFIETPDGVYLNDRIGGCVIHGTGSYGLLSKLLPYLDGEHRLRDTLELLPQQNRQTVVRFLSALHTRGLLREGSLPEELCNAPVLQRFTSQRALLHDLGADPQAIMRVIDAHVVVAAHGSAGVPVARFLRDNGVGQNRGSVTEVDIEDFEADCIPEGGIVLAVCTEGALEWLINVAGLAQANFSLLPVWQLDGYVFIGPWQGCEDGAVIRSALARAASSRPGRTIATLAMGLPVRQRSLAPAIYESVGGLVSLELFRILAGVDAGSLKLAVMRMDVETLQTTREPVVLEPGYYPDVPALALSPVESAGTGEVSELEAHYRRLLPLLGNPCGLFTECDDDQLPQLPIKLGRLRCPIPGGDVIGTDVRFVLNARVRAILRALAQYAVGVFRSTSDQGGDTEMVVIADDRLESWFGGAGSGNARVAGAFVDRSDEVVLVPLEAVTASPLRCGHTIFHPDLGGVGVGQKADEATNAALLSAWAHATARECERGTRAVHEIRTSQLPDSERGREIALLLSSLGARASTVRLLAPEGGCPLAVVLFDGERKAIWAHAQTWGEAAVIALSALVGIDQLRVVGEDAEPLRTTVSEVIADGFRLGGDVADMMAAVEAVPDVQRALTHMGYRAVAVDLTPADVATVAKVVRVVLVRAGERTESC